MTYIFRDSKLFPMALAIFAALPPLAVNTYSPAIPLVAESFKILHSSVLTTFSSYFLGFSIGILFWGTISDKYGRKNIILLGIFAYIIATLLCTISHSFQLLVSLRFIQGFTDSVGSVISFSIARDCYKGHQLTKMIASIVIIMLIAPIVAPIIGVILTSYYETWQSTFYFLAIYGIIIFIFALMIEETLTLKERQQSIKAFIPSYISHLKNPGLMLTTIVSGCLFAAMFIYISAAPIIYLHIYHDGVFLYCMYYSIVVLSCICANMVIKKISEKIDYLKYGFISSTLLAFVCTILFIISSLHLDNGFVYTIFMCFLCFAVSFSCTLFYSYSMNHVSTNFGTANSIANSLKNIIAGSSGFLISFYHGRKLIEAAAFFQIIFTLFAITTIFIIFLMKKTNLIRFCAQKT